MEPKDYLRKMVDNTIKGDTKAAEQNFKDYILPKTMEVLGLHGNSETSAKEDSPDADAGNDSENDSNEDNEAE